MPNNPIPERDQKIIKKLSTKLSIGTIADVLEYSRPTIRKYAKDRDEKE